MFKHNQKLKVISGHKYHSNRIGYFQFMGGPKSDCVVMTVKPVLLKAKQGQNTTYRHDALIFFVVSPSDVFVIHEIGD